VHLGCLSRLAHPPIVGGLVDHRALVGLGACGRRRPVDSCRLAHFVSPLTC
jgi:hypothetical protein